MSEVATAAWQANGSPSPATGDTGTCPCCGREGEVCAAPAVSKSFTGFDGWHSATGVRLCPACTWAHTWPSARRVPLLVGKAHTCASLTRVQLRDLLMAPVGRDVAVVVPLRPGRKHVLPQAQWSMVNTEAGQLHWGTRQVQLLRAVVTLRQFGIPAGALRDPAPPYRAIAALPPAQISAALAAWSQLREWRVAPTVWMSLAIYLAQPAIVQPAIVQPARAPAERSHLQ